MKPHSEILWALVTFLAASAWIATAQVVDMPPQGDSGFHVDYSQVKDNPDLLTIRAAMARQIQMVLEVGLPGETLRFFKSVPITVIPGPSKNAGQYIGRSRSIKISAQFLLHGKKPVLIHELLHAYHGQELPRGNKNPEIMAFYNRAKGIQAYAPSSHMMANPAE